MATPTGRLRMSEPVIQNIPIRTAEGAAIRDAFINAKRNATLHELRMRGWKVDEDITC